MSRNSAVAAGALHIALSPDLTNFMKRRRLLGVSLHLARRVHSELRVGREVHPSLAVHTAAVFPYHPQGMGHPEPQHEEPGETSWLERCS